MVEMDTLSKTEIDRWLSIAQKAALLAGNFLSEGHQTSRQINKDLAHDVKIEADLQSERMILEYLKKESDFSILSEESGEIKGARSEMFWIVDPVDGSLNYVHQIPMSCVSIGLWRKDEPILGVVYDFNRSELFWGICGQGAWLNDQPIKVSQTEKKEKAILCSGFPAAMAIDTHNLNTFIKQIQSYRKIRFLGSAALSITYVACGRVDGYYERDVMWWDIAGAIPLVVGAGGQFRLDKKERPFSFDVDINNGRI